MSLLEGPLPYDPEQHCHMGFDCGQPVLNGIAPERGTLVFTALRADEDGGIARKVAAFCKTQMDRISSEHPLAEELPESCFGAGAAPILKVTALATDHRFRHRGLAARLVGAAHEIGERKGALLTVVSPLDSAIGYYLKSGFEVTSAHGTRVLVLNPARAARQIARVYSALSIS
jgi:GNAT superfamily N-acetyltransferase